MKWLDKYNDIQSAQKGKTITVDSKNDPRYKAYNDSLRLYEKGKIDREQFNKQIKEFQKKYPGVNLGLINRKLTDFGYIRKDGPTTGRDIIGDPRRLEKIAPVMGSYVSGTPTNATRRPDGKYNVEMDGKMVLQDDVKKIKSLYQFAKPKQPVVYKPEIKTTSKQKPSASHIEGLTPIGINTDFELNAVVPENIPVAAKQPKYYKIIDTNNQKFGGGPTEYQVEDLNELRELPKELWDRKIVPQYQEGGVIKDDRGQWAHPGKVTQINSNFITMKNVPYPVLGISDTGDTKIMHPEKDYEFIGKNVTEYPMAKNGKKLANFTQSGNWLSKYQ